MKMKSFEKSLVKEEMVKKNLYLILEILAEY